MDSRFFGQVEFHLFSFSFYSSYSGIHWRKWGSIIESHILLPNFCLIVVGHSLTSVHFGHLIIAVTIDDIAPATITFAS